MCPYATIVMLAPSPSKKGLLSKTLSINQRLPLLLCLAWVGLYAPRPFSLGIYHDDWWSLVEPVHATAPFSLDRLHWFLGFGTNYGSRVVLGFFGFVVSSLCGSSAFRLQLASILIVLAAALSLRAWLARLGERSTYRLLAADAAVIFWLAMPWMLGVTAWPMTAQTLIAQIFFTEAARGVLSDKALAPTAAVRFGLLLLASFLSYETFYFEIFPVLAYYGIFKIGPGAKKESLRIVLFTALAAQAAAIAWNRYGAGRGGPAKSFSKDWILGFLSNLHWLPKILQESVGHAPVWWTLVAIFAAAGLFLLRTARFQSGLGLLGLSSAAVLISAFVYALAGYGFKGLGTESRTMFSASWAFTIGFYALCLCAAIPGSHRVRVALLASAAGLIVLMAAAEWQQVRNWAEVWRQEQHILAVAPVEEIRECPTESAILFDGPSSYRDITIFDAPWDLTAAVFSLPALRNGRRPYQNLAWLYPVVNYTFSWDGSMLVMTLPNRLEQRFPTKHLYLWRAGSPHLEALEPGYQRLVSN